MRGTLANGKRILGLAKPRGLSLVAKPPARINAFKTTESTKMC